jgi:uncharacterized protein YjbI with pentapeptide repeats
MGFLKQLFPTKESELDVVKRLLYESSGARDFLKRARSAGFKLISENFAGVTMAGQNCNFIFSVLESHGSDKIFSFVFKDKRQNGSVTLIREGNALSDEVLSTAIPKPSKDVSALLDKLHQGPDRWNEWRTSNPEVKIVLQTVDLNCAKLRHINLRGSDLTEAILKNADLFDANLTNVIFKRADLSKTDLSNADLTGADLSSANLSGGVYCPGANFTGANLSGANMSKFNMGYQIEHKDTRVIFSCANLNNANLTDAYLRGSDFSKADLQGTDFNGALFLGSNFTGANLRDAKNLRTGEMKYADFTDTILPDGTKYSL